MCNYEQQIGYDKVALQQWECQTIFGAKHGGFRDDNMNECLNFGFNWVSEYITCDHANLHLSQNPQFCVEDFLVTINDPCCGPQSLECKNLYIFL